MAEYLCCVNCNQDTDKKPIPFENSVGEPLCEECYEYLEEIGEL
jgi:hypothetical protein